MVPGRGATLEGGEAERPALEATGCSLIEVPEVRSRIWLAWGNRGLTELVWCDAGAGPPETAGWRPEASLPAAPLPEAPLPPSLQALPRYLTGEGGIDPAALPVDLSGTPFQCQVWQGLRDIPRGQVRSYGALANALGSPRATRAVGQANGRNPVAIVVPCHRVVRAGYRLGGYSAGLERKRFLLHLEGVLVEGDRVYPGQLRL